MITRESAKDNLFAFVNGEMSMKSIALEQAIDEIYDSIDEELEAREKNTARIRKRRDELYEELGRYRQEYTKIKQKLDSIGTCDTCKHYLDHEGLCSLAENKQCLMNGSMQPLQVGKKFNCPSFERK